MVASANSIISASSQLPSSPAVAAGRSCRINGAVGGGIRRYASSVASKQQERTRIGIPPNLKIDPRSSFAPSAAAAVVVDPPPSTVLAEEEGKERPDDINDSSVETKIPDEESDLDAFPLTDDDDDDLLFLNEPEVAYAVPLPERLHATVHTLFAPEHSSEVGTIWLNERVFGQSPIRVDLLKRSVDYCRNKMRGKRTAKTKTISEVSGSGRKLRQQKGTGMARVGHRRPPHFRGGAKAHGPKNLTDYGNTKLNKKVKKQALCHALSQKLYEGNLILLNQLHDLPTHKTGELARLLEPWDIAGKYGKTALILDHYYPRRDPDGSDEAATAKAATSYRGVPINLWVASSNLHKLKVGNDLQLNVYDIIKYDKLVLTLEALTQIEKRLENVYY